MKAVLFIGVLVLTACSGGGTGPSDAGAVVRDLDAAADAVTFFDSSIADGTTTDALAPIDAMGGRVVVSVSVGKNVTCALTASGGVLCWGCNVNGELGNSTQPTSPVQCLPPVQVTGLTTGVTAISLGPIAACAVAAGGSVQCWGDNTDGYFIGQCPYTSCTAPVQIASLTNGVTSVSVGGSETAPFACAVTAAGSVQCWGYNGSGQLGNNSRISSSTPVQVTGLTSGATAVSAGLSSACAITATGVQCWGDNTYGALGSTVNYPCASGTTCYSSVPVPVAGLSGTATAIAVGGVSACAIVNGGVHCWGNNGSRQLGDPDAAGGPAPVPVSGLTGGVASVCLNGGVACASTMNGGVQCWGSSLNGR